MTWPPPPDHGEGAPGWLAGLKVLDLSNFLPGPFCTQMLADLGADVIKVEAPTGDPSRQLRDGMFQVANRNKRGVVLDLKTSEQQRAIHSLATHADVLVEGFRPGVAARLGVGYDELSRIAPRLVYCSLSGYGQVGPARDRGGHDLTFLAASGALAVSPEWGQRPHRSGVPVADLAAASFAAVAILAALRERDRTGRGCHLDGAITDASLAFISPRCGPNFAADPAFAAYPANDVFVTEDGRALAVAAVESKFWNALVGVLRRHDDRITDPRFDTAEGRHEHGDELSALLKSIFVRRSLRDWTDAFAGVDVPIEPVVTAADASRTPQVRGRGIIQCRDGETQVVFPVLADGQPLGRFQSRAPELGEHNDAVLRADSGSDQLNQRR
jgi:crotonobetainyl-CoA:carnitine CoA-transferase CaiB-like acyl-CoA transferase